MLIPVKRVVFKDPPQLREYNANALRELYGRRLVRSSCKCHLELLHFTGLNRLRMPGKKTTQEWEQDCTVLQVLVKHVVVIANFLVPLSER